MEDIHQGWLDISASKSNSKNWLKKTITKPWKKKYFVLRRDAVNRDRILLLAFDKEENSGKQKPKKVLDLFPKYHVAKMTDLKGREYTFQVSNDNESWFLAAKNQKVLDLWVIQIQMQTKLSRSISGRLFNVKAANTKQLQRIGAKEQSCLLHFTKWGLTLALQESRSVLALWPLGTIRNYECTGTCQFIFEAGRRSPMGEGKYAFFTFEGDDEKMFNVIDVFVSARLESKANLAPDKNRPESSDDDILIAYDKHHSCVLGNPPPEVFEDDTDYSRLSRCGATLPMSMATERPPSYDHLAKMGAIRPVPDDLESCPPSSYDQLDRMGNWNQKDVVDEAGYHVIDRSKGSFSNNYDHLDRIVADQGTMGSGPYSRFNSVTDSEYCQSPIYPLSRHEPSVPNLPDRFPSSHDDRSFFEGRCGSITSTNSDMMYANTASPPDADAFQVRQNSTGGRKQRRTTGERTSPSSSIKDEPPPLPSRSSQNVEGTTHSAKPVPKPGDPLPTKTFSRQESEYQNT